MVCTLASPDWVTEKKWEGPMIAAVREALGDAATINEPGDAGRTALMNAAQFCADPDVVQFLCTKGADVHAADAGGKTALHFAVLNSCAASRYATHLLAAGADPRTADSKGASPLAEAKKKKASSVLAVLEAWQPPPPSAEVMDAVRAQSWYAGWRATVFAAVDKGFDTDAEEFELVGIAEGEDEQACHHELAALTADLEAAYKSGAMGGGSFRQTAVARIAPAHVVSKLSKLKDDLACAVVFCAAAKRDGVSRKLDKYNAKCGERIAAAWADK